MSVKKPVFPRKSASQTRSLYTVECIVEAAARILEEDGMERYTTNAIAERAGVSVGSLYQYFPNKDSITAELWRRSRSTLIKDVAIASRHADWRLAIIGMADAAVRHQLQRPDLAVLLDRQQQHFESADVNGPIASMILPYIEQVLAASKLPLPYGPSAMASDLFSITRGLTDSTAATGERDSSSLFGRVCRALFGYLRIDQGDFADRERYPAAQAQTP
ncbi:hypothetical protein ASE36_21865 [Rhizobium sp. Root274]|uniref:TetR/AcrR family transcriptional regulator n=1 Tax=unclassified Rhizobium TaxID=2613769 RepID=UPI000712EBE1|nr:MULTISPECIES: TetR/AcrR family transcriptional regulator [unclassified Rhizobium]KQW30266.1 hypothetical protein ASC71_21925 [Rhizobium sp. Root1240]KRD31757.1 hypothetical protein ASE36_21865 [Rhizobium sp. Root274]